MAKNSKPEKTTMPIIIAVANQKGGVGKTTTVQNLSAAILAHKPNMKILMLDLDPQGSLTIGSGVVTDDINMPSMYHLLASGQEERTLQQVTLELTANLHLVPSNILLANQEYSLIAQMAREQKLKNVLLKAEAILKKEYDFIFIDCPPSLGILNVNGLVAADYIIIPVVAEFYSLVGIQLVTNTINSIVVSGLNPKLQILGLLLSRFKKQLRLAQQAKRKIEESGYPVFKSVIRENVKVAEAPGDGQSVTDYDYSSLGAEDYTKLAVEFIKLIKDREKGKA